MTEMRITYDQSWITYKTPVLYCRFWLKVFNGFEMVCPHGGFFEGVWGTYQIKVSKAFLLNGKKGYDSEIYGEVKGSELDIDYLKIANIIPTKRYGVWKKALKMFSDGKSKKDILDYLKTEAVAEVLSKS